MNFPKTVSENQNLSKILIPLLYTCLTDFLEVFQGLIRINPQSMPVGYKRVIIVSDLQMLGGKKSVSWHLRNKFLLPFSLPFPLSFVKQLSRGQDAAYYILTMQLVIISVFSFYYNSLAVQVSIPRKLPGFRICIR